MDIALKKVGKRFRKNWIFRNIDLSIASGQRVAILGPNGSGKSTLLQIASTMTMPSEGTVEYNLNSKAIQEAEVYKQISISAPYMQLFESLSLRESIDMHNRFKPWVNGLDSTDIPGILQLENFSDQVIGEFSSGMKQRLKLGLAMLSDVAICMLDEPASNLDKAGRKWYRDLVDEFCKDKSLLICSNHMEEEYDFCTDILDLSEQESSLVSFT